MNNFTLADLLELIEKVRGLGVQRLKMDDLEFEFPINADSKTAAIGFTPAKEADEEQH